MKSVRVFSVMVVVLGLAGCVAPVVQPAKAPEIIDVGPTPTCSTTETCQKMWVSAIDAIQMVTGMKVRTLTDSYIDTFVNARRIPITGSVSKIPLGGGRYEIKSRVGCASNSNACGDLPASGTKLFNTLVGGSTIGMVGAETPKK